MDCAARIIQHRRKKSMFERSLRFRDITLEARNRVRVINVAKTLELSRQWRQIKEGLRSKCIPERVVASYLTIILELIKDEIACVGRRDRAKIIPQGALVLLRHYIKIGGFIGEISKQLVNIIAKEKENMEQILKSNIILCAMNIFYSKEQSTSSGGEELHSSLAIFDTMCLTVCQTMSSSNLKLDTNLSSSSESSRNIDKLLLKYLYVPQLFRGLVSFLSVPAYTLQVLQVSTFTKFIYKYSLNCFYIGLVQYKSKHWI